MSIGPSRTVQEALSRCAACCSNAKFHQPDVSSMVFVTKLENINLIREHEGHRKVGVLSPLYSWPSGEKNSTFCCNVLF